ncbi:hypothetical protein [Actinokineospora globicatena]|uniref:hypothetical protein n=1 Tax=Actinokineospora globicatena TaxID=103729 RepID=UPI0020A3BEF7|nr:hypothetical protein [Actinokineospora globicatena]MCP2300589.1 hypothetical protein [Actinokineospora globicatena]GLW81134.1 hypothetical protein Aglo01_56150 [Actinokineospora globicatena]GLW88327.1 hypothetical protein Aglo02_59660 [Actinokineospora globicatena]
MIKELTLGLLAGALVVVVGTWPGGIPLFWAIAIAIPAMAVTAVVVRLSGPLEPIWTALPDETGSATHPQPATLAARLTEAAEDQHRFRTRIQPRLAAALTHTIGEPLNTPTARARLGPELHTLATNPNATLPDPAHLAALLKSVVEGSPQVDPPSRVVE